MHTAAQPTSWEVPDDVWILIEPILNECYPAKPKGHRRVNLRRVLNGIIFRLRTGCQWTQRPKPFGDDSTVHRHFQRWCQLGIFARIGAVLVHAWDELGGVNWQWQAAAAMGKARMGGDVVGRHPPDRGSLGPTSTIPSCWRGASKPSWSIVRRRRQRGRSPSAWIKAMTIPRAMRPWPHISTPRISGASARKHSLPTARRPLRHAGGWWSGRWPGSPKAEDGSSGMRQQPSTS
jgi:transposase